jgi:putative ABC transport system permease protein
MRWLRNLFFRRHANDDLAEEIEQHIAERIAALIQRGRSPEEAAREARRAFGNRTLAREHSIEVWQWRWLENLWADLRFALHQLRKSPGYALTAILTLAIGIGANAAIFTLIDDIMLRSLPVSHPSELVEIGYRSPATPEFINGQSFRTFDHLRQYTHGLGDLSGWMNQMVSVPDDQGTLRSIASSLVTGNALSVLGLRPFIGRLLTSADDVPGGPEGGWPAVLDYGFWQSNYHGDPAILGKHIVVSGQPVVVVGVLPSDFHGIFIGVTTPVYLPSHFVSTIVPTPDQDPYIHPEMFQMLAFGRLRPGASLATLNAELAAASPSFIHELVPAKILANPLFRQATLTARSGSRGMSFLDQQFRQPLLLLQGIVLLVLLLCCINLGGLQTSRLRARQHEFAVRTALGATRSRVVQQCLTESLLLAFIGSVLAAALAWFSTVALGAFLTPAGSADATILRPDTRVLALTSALALLTTLLFGLAPALLASRSSSATLLKTRATSRRTSMLRRRIFIPAQFALALVLVLGAGLFSQTLLRLRSNYAGFNAAHVMEVCAQFQSLKKTPAELAALYRTMTDDLRARPGVQAATYSWVTPLTTFAPAVIVHTAAQTHIDHSIDYNDVGDGYFSTMETRLLSGHEFTADDHDRSTCVLNESAAHTLFPGGSALGETVMARSKDDQDTLKATCRIVGLVEDAHYANLRDPAPPTLYFPAGTAKITDSDYTENLVFMIRSQTDAEAIAAYRATLARYAPNTGIMTFLPLRDQVDQSLGSERLIAILTNVFAGIALLLSAIGIFGLLALRVQQRIPEFGVRIAVGATRGHLLKIVLGDALRMVAIGSVCGLALAGIGYVFIRRFLYGTSPADIRIALASLLALVTVATLAAAIPARRAASLNPTQALRAE